MNATKTVQPAAAVVAEAATLLAVVSLPLYFTTLSENGYEAEKSILLRVLAIVAAAGFALSIRSFRGMRHPQNGDRLVLLALAVVLAYCIGTVFSIDARLSLWGSLGRQQGLWTHAAYLIFFLIVALRLRSALQRRRLVTMLLFGSLPIIAYALVQQLGADPLPSTGDPNTLNWPVRATMGQHVFLGSYLVMVLPFTAVEAWRSWRVPASSPASVSRRDQVVAAFAACGAIATFFGFVALGNVRPTLYALFPGLIALYAAGGMLWWRCLDSGSLGMMPRWAYTFLLGAQVVALAATGARGAWMGSMASGLVLAFLVAWRERRSNLWSTILVISVVAGAFLLLLNIPGGPLQSLRTVHGLNRLANITDSGGAGGSGQGRLLIWQGVGSLMTQTPPVGGRWGGPLRAVVGYGPESMHWAFQAVFPLKLRQVTSEIWTWDRAHNVFLDNLVDAGILGLFAVLAALGVFLKRVFVLSRALDDNHGYLLVAAGAAVVGHCVDGFFGLDTAVTLLLLWVALALAVTGEQVPARVVEAGPVDSKPLVVYGACLVGVGAVFLVWARSFDHPALTALVWLVGTVTGIAVVAHLLGVSGGDALHAETPPSGRRTYGALAAMTLAVLLTLGSQFRVETANISERTGLTYLAEGQAEQAASYLQQASMNLGVEPQFETELAQAYLTLYGSRANTSGPVITPSSDTARTLPVSVREQLGQGQLLELSLASLTQAQVLAPLDPDTANNLGNVLLQANSFQAALAQYARARALSKDNPRYFDQTAWALMRSGKPLEAAAWARRALKLDDTFWYAHYMLALVDDQQGAKAEARAEAEQALIWMRNYWPQPAAVQVNQLRALAQAG